MLERDLYTIADEEELRLSALEYQEIRRNSYIGLELPFSTRTNGENSSRSSLSGNESEFKDIEVQVEL